MHTRKLSLILLASAILLSGCKVKIEDTEECAVAGVLSAGMNCAWRLSGKTREMDLDAAIKFLEDGAVCRSSEHTRKQQTALKQACEKLGNACSLEIKEALASGERATDKILSKNKAGKK